MEDVSDADLVAAWRAGDRSAFEALVERFEPRLMSYLTRITRNRAEAEDLFQEAFLRVYRDRKSLSGDVPFAFYLLRIGRNLAISRSRRMEVERRAAPLLASRPAAAAPLAEEEAQGIRRAVAELPEELGEVVSLKIWGGLAWKDIGRLMEYSEDTAARRFAEALKILSTKVQP